MGFFILMLNCAELFEQLPVILSAECCSIQVNVRSLRSFRRAPFGAQGVGTQNHQQKLCNSLVERMHAKLYAPRQPLSNTFKPSATYKPWMNLATPRDRTLQKSITKSTRTLYSKPLNPKMPHKPLRSQSTQSTL